MRHATSKLVISWLFRTACPTVASCQTRRVRLRVQFSLLVLTLPPELSADQRNAYKIAPYVKVRAFFCDVFRPQMCLKS